MNTPNRAVALRIKELLSARGISQYRLEQNSRISRSQMDFILKDRNKSVSFTTVLMLARGFGMSLVEFLSSPYFAEIDFD
jgi:transcriptional regulator with XRE-family HTH domain